MAKCGLMTREDTNDLIEKIKKEFINKFPDKSLLQYSDDFEAIAITKTIEHNIATRFLMNTQSRILLETETGTYAKVNKVKSAKYNRYKEELTITTASDKQFTFKVNSATSNPTAKGKIVVSTDVRSALAKAVNDSRSINNTDNISNKIDEAFESKEVTKETLNNLNKNLKSLDIEHRKDRFDEDHSKYLDSVLSTIQGIVGTLDKIDVEISDKLINELVEPLGEFDIDTGKIRIALANNSTTFTDFNMTNQETFIHEVVHAVLDEALNNKAVRNSAMLQQLHKAYNQAKASLTVEDFKEGNINSRADEVKAQEIYDHIFDTKNTKSNLERLHEFTTHALTNKIVMNALNKIELKDTKTYSKTSDESLLTYITRVFGMVIESLVNKVKELLGKKSSSKNKAQGKEYIVKTFYNILAIQRDYDRKVMRSNLKLDEEFSNMLNDITSKADLTIEKGVDKAIDAVTDILNLSKENDNGERLDRIAKTNAIFDKLVEDLHKAYKENSKYLGQMEIEDKISKVEKRREKAIAEINVALDTKELEVEVSKIKNTLAKQNSVSKLRYPFQVALASFKLAAIVKRESNIAKEASKAGIDYGSQRSRILVSNLMNDIGWHEDNFLRRLIRDFSGGRYTLQQLADKTMEVKSKMNDLIEVHREGVYNDITKGFTKIDIADNKNKKLNQSLYYGLLRTDAQSLGLDATEIHRLLTEEGALKELISNLENYLNTFETPLNPDIGKTFINNSKGLAEYMLKGTGLRGNATLIASSFNDIRKDAVNQELVDAIDKLASLYALEATDNEVKNQLVNLINIDHQGVNNFLNLAYAAQQSTKESLERLGIRETYVKGQKDQTVNSNKHIVMTDMRSAKLLKSKGYKLVGIHKANNNVELGIYIHNNKINTDSVVGGFTRTSKEKFHLPYFDSLFLSGKNEDLKEKLKKDRAQTKALEYKLKDPDTNWEGNLIHPAVSYNNSARVMNIQAMYSMPKRYLEEYMDLDDRGVETLSKSFQQSEKEALALESNKELVEIILKDSKDFLISSDITKDTSRNYVILRPSKLNSEVTSLSKEEKLWLHLPQETREYIQNRVEAVTGKPFKHFVIRKDLIDQLFGYQLSSVADTLFNEESKVKEYTRFIGKLGVDLVSLLKSNVVVKNLDTFIGNVLSNAYFMFYEGIPFKDMTRLTTSVIDLHKELKNDKDTLARLERDKIMARDDTAKRVKIERDIEDIKEKIKSNTINDLIDAGLLQMNTEDIDFSKESTNQVVRLVNKGTGYVQDKVNIPKPVNVAVSKVVGNALLTKESELGKVAYNLTKYSDFVFRAVTYMHGLEKGESKKTMLREVTDNFINYNRVISSRPLQVLDKVGVLPFIKYFLNIQRVMFRKFKRKSTRVSATLASEYFLDAPSSIFNSNVINRLSSLSELRGLRNLWDTGTNLPIKNFFEGIL